MMYRSTHTGSKFTVICLQFAGGEKLTTWICLWWSKRKLILFLCVSPAKKSNQNLHISYSPGAGLANLTLLSLLKSLHWSRSPEERKPTICRLRPLNNMLSTFRSGLDCYVGNLYACKLKCTLYLAIILWTCFFSSPVIF